MSIHLDQIAPWGRSMREYELMFALTGTDFAQGVLDCGGGPASFAAEAAAEGHRVVSVDPVYAFSGDEIRARFEVTAPVIMNQVRATPGDWSWSFHRDADGLLLNRATALDVFLDDYSQGLAEERYIVGELPSLPFESGQFGLAVCSHLLFLYSNLLTTDFHVESVRELCRVAREVRIFPLLTLGREPSHHLGAVRSAVEAAGWRSEIVGVTYELQRGANAMLRVVKA